MSNPNDPAYPHLELDGDGCPLRGHTGMTIRQRFVMAAMQGLAFRSATGSVEWLAGEAVRLADAALAEEARTRSKA